MGFPDYGEASVPNSHSEQHDDCGQNSIELRAVGVVLPEVGVFMEVSGWPEPAIGGHSETQYAYTPLGRLTIMTLI